MARLNDLRPNLDALLKEDPRAAKKTPVPAAPATSAGATRGDAAQTFADRIAGRHDVQARPTQPRTSTLADAFEEPEVLRNKPNAGERRVALSPGRKPRR